MKRILYIATSDITKKTGGGIANLAILNSLIRHYGNIVDVLHYKECIKHSLPYNIIPVPNVSRLNKLKSMMCGRIHRFYPWLDTFLQKNADKYSHCIINTGILGDYINKFHQYGIKVAVIHHNYEVEFQLDNKRPSTLYGLTGYFVSNNEKAAYHESDMNLFLSEDDVRIFHDKYSKNNNVSEYVIGIFEPEDQYLNNHLNVPLSSNRLAICGSLNSIQSNSGIKNFKANCLPILEQEYKDSGYKLLIAGRDPSKSIINLSVLNNNIEIIANPQNMADVIKDCGIFICPTNVGGGIKLRILDGLKMGMPILTHEVSARGYNVLHNFEWFQSYNDSKSFSEGLSKIRNIIKHNPLLRKDIVDSYNNYFSASKGDLFFKRAMDIFIN